MHARTHSCTSERNAQTTLHRSASTTHHNRELPEIFLALASTTIFYIMDGPKNVMQVRLRLAQDEKPIFYHNYFS